VNAQIQSLRDTLVSLLDSVQRADVEAYQSMVDKDLTCFEPETRGHQICGIDFHLFMTTTRKSSGRYHLEIVDPVFRVYGDTGYASYTLLASREGGDAVRINAMNETRIFVRQDTQWKMVHFHRSPASREN